MPKQSKPNYSYWQNAQKEQIAFELEKQKPKLEDNKNDVRQERKEDAEAKKTAKLQKRNEILQKRIEASHQPMNGMKLFNRWLRARKNPIYGVLYLGLAYFIIQQQGWLLVGYIALYIFVIFPLILTSDGHMGTLRNFEDHVMVGGSLLTLGIAGVITQYTTKDGSIPQQKSLSNPITFATSLVNKDRRTTSKQASKERNADLHRREQTFTSLINYILANKTKTSPLTYSDINHLCQTTMFIDHEELEVKKFFREDSGNQFGHSEVNFWAHLIRRKIGTLTDNNKIRKIITKNDYELLKQTYFNLPHDVYPLRKKYQANLLKEKLRRQQLQETIDREQLPELRIRELGLPIPRGAQNAWDFENICRDWLEAWGDTNVQVTQRSGDGGIDVLSDHCVAQVKFYSDKPVGRPELQQLKGAAVPYGDPEVVFFAYNGYTDQAIMYAEEVSMCLFDFHAHLCTFNSRNSHANELIKALAHSHLPK
jgi:hypothetical protein